MQMDSLSEIRNQRQRLARYVCQARRGHAKKILYSIRKAMKRLDRTRNLIQAEKRTSIHA